ncbi:MAG: sigma-70 family RNA polymerase sigma factor [Gammaproteobacteria bacterium]|nr:sigma-70 family RNA polymerase sigma factor [Gammaproteobacteria bacterium]
MDKSNDNNPPQVPTADSADQACCELLAAIARREQSALESLYDMTVARVYGVALRITGRRDAAEEVVADVYWQVWQQAGRYDAQRGSVLAWLLTICRSRALDHLRRRDKAEFHPEPQTLDSELSVAGTNPEDLLSAVERESVVHAALQGLSAQQRQLIALAFFKGMSHQEIATYTAIPLGTVKTHLRKALAALQQLLNSHNQLSL